jgi:hypothetical protein
VTTNPGWRPLLEGETADAALCVVEEIAEALASEAAGTGKADPTASIFSLKPVGRRPMT